MKDDNKTKKQLIHELTELRSQNAALNKSITEGISAELIIEEARRYAESIVETVRDPLLVLDADLKIISANRNFYRTFRVIPGETIGSFIYDLGNKQWDIPKLRELLEEVLPEKEAFEDFEVAHTFQDIGHKSMLLNAREIYRKDIGTKMILLAIEDITEHKLSEEKLLLAAIVQSSRDAIIGKSLDGIITSWNQGAEEIYGYTKSEIIGKSISVIVPPRLPDELTDILRKIKLGERIESYETVRRRKDGQKIYVSLTVSAIHDAEGRMLGASTIARDITERKQLEKLLMDSEEQYRLLFETANDGILLIEKNEGKIVHINPSVEKMLGYSARESIGNKLQDVGLIIDNGDFQITMKNLNDKGILRYSDIPVKTKSGQDIYTDTYLVDKAKFAQCNIRDITERKRVEEALINSEKKYRNIFENATEGIFQSTPEGRYISINPAFAKIGGYNSLDEMMESITNIKKIYVHQEDRTRLLELLNKHDIVTNFEAEIRRRDNAIIWISMNVRAIRDRDHRIIFLEGTIQDITERKRAEDALRESEANYRQLFDKAPTGIYQINFRTGKFSKANDAFCEYLACSQEEITSLSPYNMMTKESQNIFLERINEMALGDKVREDPEFEIINKNGKRTWVQLNTKNIYDSEGLVGADVVAHDITDRKRAEEALKESEERYRSIFENAQEGIFRSTPEGEIIMSNQAMAKMFGYEAPEERKRMTGVTDMTRQHYVNPEDRRKLKEMIEEHGFIKGYEAQSYRKDGSIIWISLTMHAVRDEKGQSIYYDGMIEEITNRKQTVEHIRKALGATVRAIAVTVETRDPYTAGHQRRVADLACAIATEMNLSVDQIDGIRMAATIHDLGKISVPADILSKPIKLTNIEFSLIKTHSQSGYDILKDIDFPWPVARTVLEHHERMNGSGYPNGLTGDHLLLESRILAVADVVESMASHRPYRPSLGIEAALEEIEKNRGTLYDADAVNACLRVFREKGYQLQ